MQNSLIAQAIELLNKGELVAFPTDTVYGLGALAVHSTAVRKLFEVKQRPFTKPCSLLIPSETYLGDWIQTITEPMKCLAGAFWPGPLTILGRPSSRVLPSLTAHSNRIGIRVPQHPVALSLLKGVNTAIAAPSANLSNHWSPTHADIVRHQFKDKIPLILEDDDCAIGIESTVIDMTEAIPRIIRLGAISQRELEQTIGQVTTSDTLPPSAVNEAIECRMHWVNLPDLPTNLHTQEKSALLTYSNAETASAIPNFYTRVPMPNQALAYQAVVYRTLHKLKQQGYSNIWIEVFPNTSEWASLTAILNRWCRH